MGVVLGLPHLPRIRRIVKYRIVGWVHAHCRTAA